MKKILTFCFLLTFLFTVWVAKAINPADSASVSGPWGLSFGYSAVFNRAVRTLTLPDLQSYPMEYGWMDGAMVSAGLHLRCQTFQPTLQLNYLIIRLEGNYEKYVGPDIWYTESALKWHELGFELLVPACWKVGSKGRVFVGGGVGINLVAYQNEEASTERLTDSVVVGFETRNKPISPFSWAIPIVAGYSFPLTSRSTLAVNIRYTFTPALNTEAPFNRQAIGLGLTFSRFSRRTYQPMELRL